MNSKYAYRPLIQAEQSGSRAIGVNMPARGVVSMAQIQKKTIKNKNLTILKVTGKVASNEIIKAFKEFYESEPTLNLLWDLSQGDLSDLTSDQLRKIISAAKKYANLREGGKTALYTTVPLGFGIARMYEMLAEANQLPIPNRVFRSFDEAMAWLES